MTVNEVFKVLEDMHNLKKLLGRIRKNKENEGSERGTTLN